MSKIGSINLIGQMLGAMSNTMLPRIPNMTISNSRILKDINTVGAKFSSPENRLILGASALMTQPFIDASNKKVDEETRKVSVARTIAKIIAGTLTGYFVRAGCIKLIDSMTKLPTEIANAKTFSGKMRTLFTPDAAKSGILKDLTKYKNSLGTILALGVMVFTNFLIDAPLTKYLTNKFVDYIHKNDKNREEKS